MTSRFTLGGPLCFTIKPTVRGTGKLTARTGPLAHSSQWLRAQPPLSHSCSPGATTLAGVVPHLRGRSLETPPTHGSLHKGHDPPNRPSPYDAAVTVVAGRCCDVVCSCEVCLEATSRFSMFYRASPPRPALRLAVPRSPTPGGASQGRKPRRAAPPAPGRPIFGACPFASFPRAEGAAAGRATHPWLRCCPLQWTARPIAGPVPPAVPFAGGVRAGRAGKGKGDGEPDPAERQTEKQTEKLLSELRDLFLLPSEVRALRFTGSFRHLYFPLHGCMSWYDDVFTVRPTPPLPPAPRRPPAFLGPSTRSLSLARSVIRSDRSGRSRAI